MKKLKKADYIIILILAVLAGLVVFISISGKSEENENSDLLPTNTYTRISDFNGQKLGIKVGSSFEQPTIDNFPDSE